MSEAQKRKFEREAAGKAFVGQGFRPIKAEGEIRGDLEQAQIRNAYGLVVGGMKKDFDPDFSLSSLFTKTRSLPLRRPASKGFSCFTDDAMVTREDFALEGQGKKTACTFYFWHMGDNMFGALFLPGEPRPFCQLYDGYFRLDDAIHEALWQAHSAQFDAFHARREESDAPQKPVKKPGARAAKAAKKPAPKKPAKKRTAKAAKKPAAEKPAKKSAATKPTAKKPAAKKPAKKPAAKKPASSAARKPARKKPAAR